VQENLRRANLRDAVNNQKFFFRLNLEKSASDDSYKEMTMNEIINGQKDVFPGLISIIEFYLDHLEVDIDTRCTISQYLDLIRGRASGKLMTTAKYIRTLIRKHPDYRFDSVVTDRINYDLMKKCDRISACQDKCPELFDDPNSKTCNSVPDSCKVMLEEVEKLTKLLMRRQSVDFESAGCSASVVAAELAEKQRFLDHGPIEVVPLKKESPVQMPLPVGGHMF